MVVLGERLAPSCVTATAAGAKADIGGRLEVPAGSDVTVVIRVRDPAGKNFGGFSPSVARIDLIQGDIVGPASDRALDANPTTRVVRAFPPSSWAREGETLSMVHVLKNVRGPTYIRVRGTNGAEGEPLPDPLGEDPWSDLWFYANPIFIVTK